jgi:integrase
MATMEYRRTQSGDRWRIRWREDGVRCEQTWPDYKAAVAFKQRVEGNGNRWPKDEDPRRRIHRGITFGQWAEVAIDRRTRANERTKADYRRDLERHMAALLPRPLDALDSGDVATWVNELVRLKLSEKTIRNLHGFASSLYVDALAQHPPLASHNPFAGKLTELASVRTEEMVFLTPPEFALVVGHAREEYRALFRLLGGTGLRYGEATALTVRDVDLFGKRRTLTVTKAWKRTGPSEYVIGEPKTRRSRRTLSLGDELVDLLIPLTAGRKGGELLFPGAGGGRLPHSEVYKRGWAPAVARARVCEAHWEPQRTKRSTTERPRLPEPCDCPGVLDKTPRIHDCRHSNASWLIAAGVPLAAISRRLGHSSIQITVDRYGHLDPALDVEVNAAVDRAMATR